MTSGIYRIVHTASNRTYIGSSINVRERLATHRQLLRNGTHTNRHLMAAWLKYGEAQFVFEPLLACDHDSLTVKEQAFMDAYLEHDLPIFNHQPTAHSGGMFRRKLTEETKRKMSLARKGRVNSPETREKISAFHRNRSPEYKAKLREALVKTSTVRGMKISIALKGHPVSLETRAKISAGHLGRKQPLEQVECRTKKITGLKRSDECRARMSVSAKKRGVTPPSRKGIVYTPEQRAAMAEKRQITREAKNGGTPVHP
jgi:group I intron endonuclease